MFETNGVNQRILRATCVGTLDEESKLYSVLLQKCIMAKEYLCLSC